MTKDEILFAIQEVVAHAGGEWPDTAGEPEVLRRVKMLARMAASHGQAPAQHDQPIACSYGDNGYACCEGGPCQADVHNDKLAEQQAPATAQADSVQKDAACEAIEKVLALFPFNALIQKFSVNNGPCLTADNDDEFYSVKRVLAFLTEIKTTLDAARKQGGL